MGEGESGRPVAEQMPSHAERREMLLDRLEYKVQTVLGIADQLETLGDEPTGEFVAETLQNIWSNARDTMPPEVTMAYDRMREIEEKIKGASTEIEKYLEGNGVSQEEMVQAQTARTELIGDSIALMENEDVRFLMNVRGIIDGLYWKYREVSKVRGHTPETIDAVNSHLKESIGPEDVVNIHWQPFEVSMVLKSPAYTRVEGKDSNGVHFRNSPISLIRESDDITGTSLHESVHNILDMASGVGSYQHDRMEEIAQRIKKPRDPQEQMEDIDRLLQYSPTSLIDQMQNELMAEFERWEEQPWNYDRKKIMNLDPNKPKSFSFHASNYSTAGRDARDIADVFESTAFIVGRRDAQKATALFDKAKQFREEFVTAVEHMRTAVRSARSMGREAEDRLHALLLVLPPRKYRHVDRYLNRENGEKFGENEG